MLEEQIIGREHQMSLQPFVIRRITIVINQVESRLHRTIDNIQLTGDEVLKIGQIESLCRRKNTGIDSIKESIEKIQFDGLHHTGREHRK